MGRFFVTRATDAAGKPSHFFCHICLKDGSVLRHGPHEVLRHFQGVKHTARDQRLRLETPGWRVLDFEGNPLSESELERWKERILGCPLVIRDREYPFAEDVIADESGAPDATLPVLAKVSSLIELLQLGGPYELVYQLWSQFTLTASRMSIDVKWSREEVLVGNLLFLVSTYPYSLVYWCCVLVDHFEGGVPSHPFSCVRVNESAWTMQHWVWRARLRDLGDGEYMGEVHVSSCLCCRIEPLQRQYYPEGYKSGQNSGCCWSKLIFVSLHGSPHVLAEAFASYLGSGYRVKLVEYPTFDLRLLKHCLQRTAEFVFGSLEPFFMTEFVIHCLKGAESRN